MAKTNSIKFAFFACFTLIILINLSKASSQYFSNAKIHVNCLKIDPTPKLTTEWGLRLFGGSRFYLPFGSTKAIKHLSQLVLAGGVPREGGGGGKKASIHTSSEKFCAQVRIKGFQLQVDGHGENFLTQDCAVVKKGQNQCIVNPNSENPVTQKYGDGIITVAWTDNESNMAIVDCTTDGIYNDWYLLSFEPTVNETVKTSVLEAMNKLGFSHTMKDTTTQSYEGCELFDPEEED